MIYLSAAQRLVVSDIMANDGGWAQEGAWNSEHMVFRLWYVVASLSSYTPSSH